VSEFDPYTEAGLFFAAFAEAPEILYVIKHEPRGRTSVHEYDLAKGELGKEVFSHPEVDTVGIVFDHEGRAVGVDYILDGYERHFFDEAAAREQRGLDQALPSGSSRIVSSSWNGKLKVVMASGSDFPPRYYLLDREEKNLSVLFSAYPELDSEPLSKTRSVSFEARDGLSLHAYVTVPAGVPEQGLPALVLVQDGPERQDWLGFSPIVQFLANRGFAVLVVNFRGTFGYGEAFEAAGREQWGIAIQDDLEDGVRWLIAEGIADPRRIGILGSGFGGYSALMGAVRTPTLYRACASFGAATDLVTVVREKQHDGLWTHDVEGFAGVWSDRKRLVATSPYDQIEKIEVPILLGHGERDARVHVKHATRMHAGLQHAGKDSELRLYELESSWLRHEENRSDFYERVARFFEQHLAPQTPPDGSALQPD
jgi:dipeptidyl aminopeptidase/acylaminoacyl peptidase